MQKHVKRLQGSFTIAELAVWSPPSCRKIVKILRSLILHVKKSFVQTTHLVFGSKRAFFNMGEEFVVRKCSDWVTPPTAFGGIYLAPLAFVGILNSELRCVCDLSNVKLAVPFLASSARRLNLELPVQAIVPKTGSRHIKMFQPQTRN